MTSTRLGRSITLWAFAAAAAFVAAADVGAQRTPTEQREIVPGAQYEAGAFRRFFLGGHYRDTWTTPIQVSLLDLDAFAGGLEPVSMHAGSQTKSLRFRGADGRRYQFRSVFKTPTATLRPQFQNTLVADLIQDGASASHPVGHLVVAPLLEATGVLHPSPNLALMPDDPALGEFRSEFAGVLGIIEERPNEADDQGAGGFGDALQVIGPTRLFERIDDGPEDQIDVEGFLTARMMDILIGDRDRHRDNWRWALLDDSGPVRIWEPISRDHDEAFVKLDGLLLRLARYYYPQLTSFAPEYDNTLNLNWHAREIDRRFLSGTERPVWDSIAAWIQGRLTDDVIDRAVLALPPAMHDVGGDDLADALKTRRDSLAVEAARYYGLLAEEVEIHATHEAELADIVFVDDRYVDVSIRADVPGTAPYLTRRFDARETRELRIGMWGGRDRVRVRGDGDPPIRVRVVGGQGRDTFEDSSRSGVLFYDSGSQTVFEPASGSTIDRKPYPEWVGSDLDRYPPRDWGAWTRPLPFFSAGADVGVLIGGAIRRTGYGFRKQPWATDVLVGGGYATGQGWGRVLFDGALRLENSPAVLRLEAEASGIEVIAFYGFGNDTEKNDNSRFYRVPMTEVRVEPGLELELGERGRIRLGSWVRVSRTRDDDGAFFASIADTLYGADDFTRAGATLGFEWDARDIAGATTRGVLLRTEAKVAPALFDVARAFGGVSGEVRAYATAASLPGRPTLAVRAGGEKLYGDVPFQESAFLGGRSTLRGFSSERFAGDAAVFGGAELRVHVASFRLMLPGNLGVFGLFDAGRVYVDGESPGTWHTGVGGGISLAFVDPASTLTIAVATGDERTTLSAGLGFGF